MKKGTVSDEEVDVNGDGLTNYAVFTFPLEFVKKPGEYAVGGTIAADNGEEVGLEGGYAVLDKDSKEIKAYLDIEQLKALKIDGPYTIKEVWFEWFPLFGSSQKLQKHRIQEFENVGSTNGIYSRAWLDQDYLAFSQYIGDRGIDTNGNGQYEYIDVTFELYSVMDGDYEMEWKASLVPVAGLSSYARSPSSRGGEPSAEE